MKYLSVIGVLLLGACVHSEPTVSNAPIYNAQSQPVAERQMVTATCGESFNASVDQLIAAMNLEGRYAFSEPVAERATAYDGRVSRF